MLIKFTLVGLRTIVRKMPARMAVFFQHWILGGAGGHGNTPIMAKIVLGKVANFRPTTVGLRGYNIDFWTGPRVQLWLGSDDDDNDDETNEVKVKQIYQKPKHKQQFFNRNRMQTTAGKIRTNLGARNVGRFLLCFLGFVLRSPCDFPSLFDKMFLLFLSVFPCSPFGFH